MLRRIELVAEITTVVIVVDMAVAVAVTTVETVEVMVHLVALSDNRNKSSKVVMTRSLTEESSNAPNLNNVTRTRHSMQRTTKASQPFEKLVHA